MSTVTRLDTLIDHEVMEPHLSGDSLWYTEETIQQAKPWRCNGCGNIWAKKWHAETCEEREHRKSFDQKYAYKPEGYATPGSATFGQVRFNVYTRRIVGVDKDFVGGGK